MAEQTASGRTTRTAEECLPDQVFDALARGAASPRRIAAALLLLHLADGDRSVDADDAGKQAVEEARQAAGAAHRGTR